jgi:hypothetical protein
MAFQELIAIADNCKRPLNKWRRDEIAAEIDRVDDAIQRLENPTETVDLSFLGWQPLGQVSRLVSLQSLRRYRRRLANAS